MEQIQEIDKLVISKLKECNIATSDLDGATKAATTYNIAGKSYAVTGYQDIKSKTTGKIFSLPIVDIPMMSDYKWQLECLNDRLEHPEKYQDVEDIEKTIERLKKWLAEHQPT